MMSKNLAILINGIMVAIIVVLIAGFIYKEPIMQYFQGQKEIGNTEQVISQEIDTSDWLTTPYFGEDLKFFFSYPKEYEISGFSDYENEGSAFIYIQNPNAYTNINEIGPYYFTGITFFYDTGQSLDEWVALKTENIKQVFKANISSKKLTQDRQPYYRICSEGYIVDQQNNVCYNYFHINDKILEINVRGGGATLSSIEQFNDTFINNLYFINDDISDWYKFESFNGGFAIDYPSTFNVIPPQILGNFYINLYYQGSYDVSFGIEASAGHEEEIIDYWFNDNTPGEEVKNFVPKKVMINGKECLFTKDIFDELNIENFYCKNNNFIYKINYRRNNNDHRADKSFYQILDSLYFIDNSSNKGVLYRSGEMGFKFIYPHNYQVYEEKSEDNLFLSLTEYRKSGQWDGQPTASLDIGYTEFQGKIEDFFNSNKYYLNIDEDKYKNSTFKGREIKFATSIEDYGYGQVNIAYRVLKNENSIITITESQPVGNPDPAIDQILNSFQFTD